MTPPDTREQARATAHGLLGPAACRCVGERHDFVCDRVADYILARDAAHAAEVGWLRDGWAASELWEARCKEARAEVATLTARVKLHIDGHQGAEREIIRLRDRLSTVERERDEGRGLLQMFDVPPDVGGDDPYEDRCLVSRGSPLHRRILACLSRSPVEGGREMVTPSGELPDPTGAASEGELTPHVHCEWCEAPPTWLFIPTRLRDFSEYGTRASCDEHQAKTKRLTATDGVDCRQVAAAPETRDMKTRKGT